MSVTYLSLFYEYSVQHWPVPFAALTIGRGSLWSQKGVSGQGSNSYWIVGFMFNIVYGSTVKNFRIVTTLWLISLKPVSTRLRTVSLNFNPIVLLNVNNQTDGEINKEESKTTWLSVQCKHHRFKLLNWKWSFITLNGSGYLSLQKHIRSFPFFSCCHLWNVSDGSEKVLGSVILQSRTNSIISHFFPPIPVEMVPIHYYPSTQKWINVITM